MYVITCIALRGIYIFACDFKFFNTILAKLNGGPYGSSRVGHGQGRRKGCATCAAAQGAIERGGAKTGGVKKI
jgi:hypothetical protein